MPKEPDVPLSQAPRRTHLHTRIITLGGYQREDGLFDIEAELKDTKSYPFATADRSVSPGEPLHHMQARLTVNEELEIIHAEAVTEAGPFSVCGGGAESFGRLAGLVIRPGFLRAANDRLGGTIGCTHLREVLQQLATVAYQTLYPIRAKKASTAPAARPRLLDTCHAYAADGPVVARSWPQFYTGG